MDHELVEWLASLPSDLKARTMFLFKKAKARAISA